MAQANATCVNYMIWTNSYFIYRQLVFKNRKIVGRISNDEFDAPGWWMTSSGGATRLILQGRIRWPALLYTCLSYTDKKENQIFLIYKEIQNGVVAKSYEINGLLIYGDIFAHFLIYYRKPFLIYDIATAPLWISLYMRKILFSLLSVY